MHGLWVEEDPSKGFQYLNKALKISKEEKDYINFYFSSFFLGVGSIWWNCEFEKAFGHFKETIDLSESMNDLAGSSFAKRFSSTSYGFQGKLDIAHEKSEESLQMAVKIGDTYSKGFGYSNYGMSCFFKGLHEKAEKNLLMGSGFCNKSA